LGLKMGVVTVANSSYHMNDNLILKWNAIKNGKLTEIDEDRAYVVDGRERSGKSLFTIQQGAYIDPKILEDQENGKILPHVSIEGVEDWKDKSEWRNEMIKRYKKGSLLPQITFNAQETLKAIRSYRSTKKETKVIIFDEAFRGMSNKAVLSKENKKLTTALMEMGQSNLVLWIVSPSFFLLELYPAVLRTNALFHVKKNKKSGKREVRIFNYQKKAMLYQIGLRRGWGYPIATRQIVNFYNIYPGGKDFEWRYRLKKQLSLREIGEEEEESYEDENKWKLQRDLILKKLYSEKKSLRKVSSWIKESGFYLSPRHIGEIIKQIEKKIIQKSNAKALKEKIFEDLGDSKENLIDSIEQIN